MFSSLSSKNSHLLRHCFSKKNSITQLKEFSRNISLFGITNRKPILLDKSQYRVVYDFPYIKFIGGIVKCKRWAPYIGFVIIPIMYTFYETTVPIILPLSTGVVYYAFGYALSKVCRNIVGKMYVKKEGDITEVMISSIDEYGRRVDRIHKLDSLMNIDYVTRVARHLGFIRMGLQDSELFYDVNLNSCKFIDERACDIIFGLTPNPFETKGSPNELESPKKKLQS